MVSQSASWTPSLLRVATMIPSCPRRAGRDVDGHPTAPATPGRERSRLDVSEVLPSVADVDAGTGSTTRRATQPAVGQQRLDELSPLLVDTTFVVVDLETTGGSAADCAITEIGAVKVRGGQVLGDFQTLVNPAAPIPAFIAVLTGITDAMVADAPTERTAVPAFMEFARGAVLVAHNAGFDVGFLRAACTRLGLEWPRPVVLDTVKLARQVVTRDEAPDVKLATLARVFRTSVAPNHRALADARATVDVLHGLLERLGNRGVHSLAELVEWQHRVTPAQRAKRRLADDVPRAAGVYLFRDGQGHVLYVGTSGNLRARVRSYFTASESRKRMAEMVGIAESVETVVCDTEIEAQVRELRLIDAHKPPYNRRSKYPERSVWLKVTVEPFPRLSVVAAVKDDGASYVGPFRSRRTALTAAEAVYRTVPIRQCTSRLPLTPAGSACVLAELGQCGAPCTGAQSVAEYAVHVRTLRAALSGDVAPLRSGCERHMNRLAQAQRFEEAAVERDRLEALAASVRRTQRLSALAGIGELVAARRAEQGGWELVVVRHARLAAAGHAAPGVHPQVMIDALLSTAETVEPGPGGSPAGLPEEGSLLLRWLGRPGTRLVHTTAPWSLPLHTAAQRAIPAADARVTRADAPPRRETSRAPSPHG
jgi:DNA polymerase III subunit epsilon